jgi:hypothetical protein
MNQTLEGYYNAPPQTLRVQWRVPLLKIYDIMPTQ